MKLFFSITTLQLHLLNAFAILIFETGVVGTITEIELTRVLERVTATYNLGLASGILYIKRRAHVSYSHMHQLLWASNSKIYFTEWVKQKKESPTTSSTSSTAWSAESTTTTLSNLNVIVGDALHSRQHRFARRHHLLLAAEYGSSEAQSQLGIDLLIPSPIPSEVIVKKGEYFKRKREACNRVYGKALVVLTFLLLLSCF